MRRHAVWRLLLVLAALAVAVALVLTRPPRLGLDLRGGTQIVLEAKDGPGQPADDDAVERTLEVLRRRVDALGVSEPSLQRSGARRIIIELPGVTDPREAVDVIGRTAQLTFRPVLGLGETPPPEGGDPGASPDPAASPGPAASPTATPTPGSAAPEPEGSETLPDEDGAPIRVGPVTLTGDAVRGAEAKIDPERGIWYVDVSFRGDGGDRWTELTAKAACAPLGDPTRRIAIILDREVISSPQVDASIVCDVGITGGQTSITGGFDEAGAQDLALLLRAGALPVPVETVEQRTVGATLGEEAVRASTVAGLIGASMTVLYMLVYYRLLGLLAAIGLAAYALLSFGLLLAIRATLTLPGVAGFVLAVGMAVDANVLVFERTKEEYAVSGKIRAAVGRGFSRAWSAIADSNATTLLAAGLLFWLGSGPVRGFGVTLSVGVVVSMFSALVVTRLMAEAVGSRRWARRHPAALGLRVGGKLRERLAQSPPDLIGRSKLWAAISAAAIVASIVGLVGPGLRFGLEFTGGRLLAYSTERGTRLDDVRAALAERGFPRAVVQHSDNDSVVVRTGVLDAAGEEQVAAAVQAAGGAAEEIRDEFIGPTLGQELRRKALVALALALAAQMAYLAVRFRWTYGLSAVAAMFHDVLLLVGAFAWMGKEVDGLFLAALLTVIGYSINDSVVVFDRIREQRQLRPTEPLATVANDACLQTIPRTINTGLGALFILVALWVLGGDTLTDFALALITGILAGTWSSVFTAAPLAVAIERLQPGPPPTAGTTGRAARPAARSEGRA